MKLLELFAQAVSEEHANEVKIVVHVENKFFYCCLSSKHEPCYCSCYSAVLWLSIKGCIESWLKETKKKSKRTELEEYINKD